MVTYFLMLCRKVGLSFLVRYNYGAAADGAAVYLSDFSEAYYVLFHVGYAV